MLKFFSKRKFSTIMRFTNILISIWWQIGSSYVISTDIYYPHSVIVLSFMFQDAVLLHRRQVTLDGALAHRQSLRHLSAGDCRRFFDEIEDFLLTLSEFRLRHISVMVSDIRGVGGGINDGLKLGWG